MRALIFMKGQSEIFVEREWSHNMDPARETSVCQLIFLGQDEIYTNSDMRLDVIHKADRTEYQGPGNAEDPHSDGNRGAHCAQ